jgi:hypothetical protein
MGAAAAIMVDSLAVTARMAALTTAALGLKTGT